MAGKKPKSKRRGGGNDADGLMRLLAERMEACPDVESLNDQVIIPFAAALESVCAARGYLLNIYGETSNVVFSGDADDAETIYRMIDDYLDSRPDSTS